MDYHLDLTRETLDFHAGDAGFFGLVVNHVADGKVLLELLTILSTFSVPAPLPGLVDPQTKTNRMYFSTHTLYSRSRKMTVMWDARRRSGLTRPRAPNRRHLRVGASSAKMRYTTRSSRLTPKFSSALATAEATTLRTW